LPVKAKPSFMKKGGQTGEISAASTTPILTKPREGGEKNVSVWARGMHSKGFSWDRSKGAAPETK